jgi:hypothetical protein
LDFSRIHSLAKFKKIGGHMSIKGRTGAACMAVLLCITVTAMSSTITAGTHSLSVAAESMVVGGGNCSDFLNGFAVGMGVASLLGCAWCAGVAVVSKTFEMFAC